MKYWYKERIQQFKNALAIVRQINAEEWEFDGVYEHKQKAEFICCTAKRKGVILWVGGGPIFLRVRDKPWELGPFGFIVWYGGVRVRVKRLNKVMKRRPSDMTK